MNNNPIEEYKGLKFRRRDGDQEAYTARTAGATVTIELDAATGKWNVYGMIMMASTRGFQSHDSDGHETPSDAVDWIARIIEKQSKPAVK